MTLKKKKENNINKLIPRTFSTTKMMRALTQLQIVKQIAACLPLHQNKGEF